MESHLFENVVYYMSAILYRYECPREWRDKLEIYMWFLCIVPVINKCKGVFCRTKHEDLYS